MFFHTKRMMCDSCTGLFHWLTGLTLVGGGVVGLLQRLEVFAVTPWPWIWPVLAIVWGLVVLFNVGCKDCK